MRREIYAQKGDNRKVLRMERREMERREMDDEERRKKRMERWGEKERKRANRRWLRGSPGRRRSAALLAPELHPGAVKAIHAVIHS